MIGLGWMGGNLARRPIRDGHPCVVYAINQNVVRELADRADGAISLPDFTARLARPRIVWMPLPAVAVQSTVDRLASVLAEGLSIIRHADVGNVDAQTTPTPDPEAHRYNIDVAEVWRRGS